MSQTSSKEPATGEAARLAFQQGNAALARGRAGDAVTWYRRALAEAPSVPAVHNNLATALLQLDDVVAAIAQAEAGLALGEDFVALHNTLGNALVRSGDLKRAAKHYRQAMRLDPEARSPQVNLANVLRDIGEERLAASLYAELLKAMPSDPDALSGLALLHMQAGRHDEAGRLLKRALTARAGDIAAMNNLAICLLQDGRRHEALALYRDLVALDPENGEAYGNLGQVLQGLGRHDEAAAALRQALLLNPQRVDLQPFLLQSLMHQCAWIDVASLEASVLGEAEDSIEAGSDISLSPFAIAATEASPALRLAVARQYSARCTVAVDAVVKTSFKYEAHDGRLRIGYVSPDFHRHSVAVSFLPLLQAHDRTRVELFGFWIGREHPDETTERFRAIFHRFEDLRSATPEAAAKLINEAGIDVLVDLAGHTRDSALEIFAWRPAPVQAHWLGYGSTIGADCIDYLLTDAVHTPPELVPFCHEQSVFLPGTFMAAGPSEIAERSFVRRDCGLPESGAVLACFNAHYKLDPKTFAVWLRLLAQLPRSVLWLKHGSETAMANLRAAAVSAGIDPDRLVWADRLERSEHLARHRLADLALDTRLHTGGVTTLDALWAGVPVLTIAGKTHAARTGASILTAFGMPELIVPDLGAYHRKALALLEDREELASVRQKVAANRTAAPLFQPDGLARHLEQAFETMVWRWREGRPPQGFSVDAG